MRNGPSAVLLAGITAAACAGMAARFGLTPAVVPFLAIIPLGCLLAAIDIACFRLPEQLVWPAIAVSLGAFCGLAAITGRWPGLLHAVLGGLGLGVAYLILALLPGGQLGLGDVTLAVLLGLYLGWLGLPFVVLGGMMPFLVNIPVAIWALVVRKSGRKAEVPFGPAMLVGAYVTIVGPPVLALALNRA